ncbi:amylo-alpha-1,6-glucosidase [Micromonospora rosaria]|uniref:Amylo-alpha-1,6-glucosidase n=1 Tax=Micromonospora rosaria TaxID=47874 RepID=A0A136PLX9_9ACTN|nr:glycogen debranching N-terminal domain-containing protein [Micromonospora rosaria]KXK59404.1 amylo-alpha-1,6-glucosidase [Micromonospora rosaria]
MRAERTQVLAGNVFAIGDAQGDMEPDPRTPTGLFAYDTRFLSHWVLTVDGHRLNALSRVDVAYFETRFLLVPGTASHYVDADVSVLRHRSIDDSFHERITVFNHSSRPAEYTIRIEVDTDFADTAEIARPARRAARISARTGEGELRLRYERDRFVRETVVTTTVPAQIDEHGLTFRVTVEPAGTWAADLHVDMVIRGAGGRDLRAGITAHQQRVRQAMQQDLADWLDRAPTLVAENSALGGAYRRCLVDLAALRYTPLAYAGRVPVAGLPWSMGLYGRDAMVACLQSLPYAPELTPATLRMLALGQGGRLDDDHDEEPGKIVSVFRYGESAAFGEEPTALYFGAADTTPLFVILLDEYERWSGDEDLVRELRHPARMALDWIGEYGDLLGDGYLRYQRRNLRNGTVNQCWKDSPNAITYADGREPAFPRATCELQGYAYDALRRGARLARQCWGDPAYADGLQARAAALRERFNRDFWLADREYYALAVEPDGTPVDALASNMGHLLWSGIVPPERAARVAEHLLGPQLWSGWGVRTLGAGQQRYNPVGTHLGSVWLWDTALIAAGLRRYGLDEAAGRLATGLFDVALRLDGRMPEVIAGYDRSVTKYPVQLPSGGYPQAWAAGSLLMTLTTVLGLDPCGENLLVDSALPPGLGRIELLDVPGRWGHSDAYGRDRARHPARIR